jgi:sarcosine oxidase
MVKSDQYDVIVMGIGSMGLSAAYYLSRAGLKVLGLERFSICNDQASHSGETRLIRRSYFEHPDYVPLLDVAYRNWQSLERISHERLFYKTGLYYLGDRNNPVISGVRESAGLYDIHVEEKQYIGLNPGVAKDSFYEPEAGYLDVQASFEVLKELTLNQGADLQENEEVLGWEQKEDGFEVVTDKGAYHANKIVITVGAWVNRLVDIEIDLVTTRQVLAWFGCNDDQFDIPCWCLDHPEGKGIYYGFSRSESGFKIGHHFTGEVVDPNQMDRQVSNEEVQELQSVLLDMFPDKDFRLKKTATCIYTNSPDEHFILDFVPDTQERVVVATGFSGHGYKFVPAVGEIISDMITKATTSHPIDFLSLKRFD